MPWNVISAFVLDQLFGYQTANKMRENLIALASRRDGRSLGGTRDPAKPNMAVYDPFRGRWRSKYPSPGPHDADNYLDVEIDGTNLTGFTVQARVEVRTNRPTVTITPRVWNVTDSVVAGTGVACSATAPNYSGTNQRQTIALTLTSGIKRYRLQYTLSGNAYDADTWCVGEIEIFATA